MNVLFVFVHPELRSLNGSLKSFAVRHLESLGHQVQVSDLYNMQFKTVLDAHDNTANQKGAYFDASMSSLDAFKNGTQSQDIIIEQEKLLWANMVIFQFPLWWYTMPAILKGWFDRVYAYGFAYGVGEHSDSHWGDRFGDGTLKGKRAMLIITAGGWQSHYSAKGINDPIDDLLFPIQHGMLYYPGFDVLPPFVVFRTGRVDEKKFKQLCEELGTRLDTLETTPPIAFRPQNHGAYHIPALTLKDHIEPEKSGFSIHTA